MKKAYFALVLLSLCAMARSVDGQVQSELSLPPNGKNQRAEVSQWIGLVKITISYHSPNVHGGGGRDRAGHIWGESLKWYFNYLARKRGVDADDIYRETAANIDLGRLPEPDEIADAVLFLASPLARAITGQCLDVNCGEYHH